MVNNELNFSAHAFGASGEGNYEFQLKLYDSVESEPKVLVTDGVCQIVLKKKNSEEPWPRLTKDKAKLPWLRVDFDYLETGDEDLESEGADDEVIAFF